MAGLAPESDRAENVGMNGRRSLAMGARNARPNGPVTPSEIRQLFPGLSGLGPDEIQTRYQYLLGLADKPDEELTPRRATC